MKIRRRSLEDENFLNENRRIEVMVARKQSMLDHCFMIMILECRLNMQLEDMKYSLYGFSFDEELSGFEAEVILFKTVGMIEKNSYALCFMQQEI